MLEGTAFFALQDCAGFVTSLFDGARRAKELLRVGAILGKWFLAGVALAVPLAASEAYTLGGIGAAWARFGQWWLLLPLGTGLFPVAFILFRALLELCWFVI